MNHSTFVSALCPDSSASRTVRKVLLLSNYHLSWYRMRKALHLFESMIMVLMPEQSHRLTRSSFKKRTRGLKAIYKVGGNCWKSSFLFFTYLGDATVKGLSFAIGSFTVCGSGDCGPLQPLGGAPRSRVESRLPEAGRILIRWGGYWEYEEEAPAPVRLRHRLVFPPNLPWSGSANCNKVSLAERSKAAGSSPVTQYYGFGGSNPPANKKKFYICPD